MSCDVLLGAGLHPVLLLLLHHRLLLLLLLAHVACACRYNAGGCHYSVFGLPAVQAVLQFKWETFAGRMVSHRRMNAESHQCACMARS